jgi:predicted metal-dependent hydrolase
MTYSAGSQFSLGVELLNRGEFYDAHEVLEDVWRAAPEPECRFLQGLIQVAVAFHHRSRGNRIGFRSLLERAIRNLSSYPAQHAGLDLAALLENLTQWRETHGDEATRPAFPQVKRQK